MEHLSYDHKDHPNQHKNGYKLCDETGHLILSLLESQWKLRQQHNQNFSMEGKPLLLSIFYLFLVKILKIYNYTIIYNLI